MIPSDLVFRWREQAEDLSPFAPAAAEAFRAAARDLEGWIAGSELEPLDMAAAEVESGYTRGHLRRMLSDGRLENAGTEGDPRILRGHLPRKPGYLPHGTPTRAPSRSDVAREIAAGGPR